MKTFYSQLNIRNKNESSLHVNQNPLKKNYQKVFNNIKIQ